MAEFSTNLWAPWRMQYISGLAGPGGGCFLCAIRDAPAEDARNHVLWRSQRTLVLLNRFPYSTGHLLVAPAAHLGDLAALPPELALELHARAADALRVLTRAVQAEGFNIGMNIGRCAGAGLPDHLHWHVVPRWGGDTNFMAVLGDVKVIPEGLDAAYAKLRAAAAELKLPGPEAT